MPMPMHLTLTGNKQGAIQGSCDMQGREGTILVESFHSNVVMPRDPQTGLSSGKRIHHPVQITKFLDRSSPLLSQALATGEHFSDVTFKFYRITPTGNEEHYFTIRLEDAIIVDIRVWVPQCLDSNFQQYQHMEDVSWTYRRIIWTHEVDTTTAQDDWQVPV